MPGWNGTLAQRSSVALGVFYGALGVIGLILNPDFGTGASTSSQQFLVDWNGWHAVLTIMLAATALGAAMQPSWAVLFLGYNTVVNSITAVWALIDDTPAGILDLRNTGSDVVLHFVVAGISLVLLLMQLRRDRATAVQPAG